MSRINDALKQARQATPRNNELPPQPMARDDDRPSPLIWIVPSLIIFLIIAGIFFMAWASAHRTMNTIVGNTNWSTNQESITSSVPTVVAVPVPATNPVVESELVDLPTLQGIFYSTTAPTAIIDNKEVSPGDHVKSYRVKSISKYAVLLTDANGKDVKLGMSQ